MAKRRNNVTKATESRLQQEICLFYRNTFCLAHHSPRCLILSIPNDACEAQATKYLQTGMYTGASDLLIIHRENGKQTRTIFAEVKTPTGTQKPAQAKFQSHVDNIGMEYHIIRSVVDLIKIIDNVD